MRIVMMVLCAVFSLFGSEAKCAVATSRPLIECFPAPGANNVSPDTSLRIGFDTPIQLGANGKITIVNEATHIIVDTIDLAAAPSRLSTTRAAISRLPAASAAPARIKSIGGLSSYNYYPVLISGNQAEIFPAPGALAYNKSYLIAFEPGVFLDANGNPAAAVTPGAWRFTTRTAAPSAGVSKLTVAVDGSGDFATLQGALDSIPADNAAPVTILLRKGIYTEMIYVANKHKISIVGEDREQTTIQYATNDLFNPGTAADGSRASGGYRRGVFRAVHCDDLTLSNLTIRNTTAHGGSQAEAIILNNNLNGHTILDKLDLYSFQDTLQINGQAYIRDCHIEGDVDFMWGTGPCFFENCHAKSVRSNAYFTQIRNPGTNHGYVYLHCTFDGSTGVTGNMLSRIAPAVYPASEVVLIDCTLTDAVGPIAWKLDQSNVAPNVHFWEFNSHAPDGKPVETTRRLAISRQLKQPDDAKIIADYSDPAFVLGNQWDPRQSPLPGAQ